jgi:hypothetical protein
MLTRYDIYDTPLLSSVGMGLASIQVGSRVSGRMGASPIPTEERELRGYRISE